MDITRRLGNIAKEVEKYDVADTTRVIGMVLRCLPSVIKPGADTEQLIHNCNLYADYCDKIHTTGQPEPESRQHNLILLHSIKTLREVEDHLLDSDYGNARELCMMCYRRGRSFLPEGLQPTVGRREIQDRIRREKQIEERRNTGKLSM